MAIPTTTSGVTCLIPIKRLLYYGQLCYMKTGLGTEIELMAGSRAHLVGGFSQSRMSLDESNTDVERGNDARDLNTIRPPSYVFLATISNSKVFFLIFLETLDTEADPK